MQSGQLLIALLVLVVASLVFYIYYAPTKVVTIVERPVYEYDLSRRLGPNGVRRSPMLGPGGIQRL